MPQKPPDARVRGIERTRRFEPVALDVRAARAFVASALSEAGYVGDVDTVLLLVSELATNAVRHARTGFELTIDVGRSGVRVTVIDDAGQAEPRVRQARPSDTDGRGLQIVDRLAATWGCDAVGVDRKAVWFTVP
jgi:anti-sigma regulatory factor (Ser/Thr protein kinase)